jgi:hypothetical protein
VDVGGLGNICFGSKADVPGCLALPDLVKLAVLSLGVVKDVFDLLKELFG